MAISSKEIRRKIEAEIGDDWSRSNLHKVELKRCLLETPVLAVYENSFYVAEEPEGEVNQPTIELWLVLEEDPVGKKGYEIVYGEEADSFGLAAGRTFIGYYGSFIATFDAM